MCIEVRMVASGLTDEAAFDLERQRIIFWQDAGVVLANKSIGGRGGMSGVTRSVESRAKQSATMTGRELSPEHVEKIRAIMETPERRALTAAIHTGRTRPPETGPRIRLAHKKLWEDPEFRARRLAELAAGLPDVVSEETRVKMRAAKTPEVRAATSAAVKEVWNRPGERERRSAAMSVANTGRIATDAARESGRMAMTPERRAASSKELKDRWSDPIKRQEMCAALSAARPKSLSPEHRESLKRSWTPERKRSVAEKVSAAAKARKELAK
jgi:hypothetical protein